MKIKFILYILLLVIVVRANAQENSIELQDLKMPVSPGFSLLDISPTNIERPSNPKSLGLNILNAIGQGSSLPKDFALEASPYWLLKHYNENIYKFLGVSRKSTGSDLSTGFFRKMTVSVATYFNDSSKNYLPNTNYTAIGVRTNLLTYWGNKRGDQIRGELNKRAGDRAKVMELFPDIDDTDEIQVKIDSIRKARATKEAVAIAELKPVISLDAAYAYSDMFQDNNYDNQRFNRSAFWVNGTLNIGVGKEDNDYLFAIANLRVTQDNILTDTAMNKFKRDGATDYGMRIGYEHGDFSLSFEHISRHYRDNKDLNSERNVGVLQYKVNESLYLYGSFGKNFGEVNNLFTLIGLNWSWGKQSLNVDN
ncbi:hypothetical protein [[Flexibacter] sp. ATCC 35208]|uniref:hypothetical protein n=1 Tax=[Flexibacter] sp. ATCC 35208 TaxID=1936242 RepID=UPI0009C8B602|nr:hypothetical protein [[Flexibacter] sp. ATCC 35208]OMP75140.1 hypothetical protein BW716_31755 [[Flexibacter] sp. ATCC 35208]